VPVVVSGPPALRGAARPLSVIVRRTLAGESRTCGELTVVFARDRELRALNRRWRGIDRATDVLSFSYDGEGEPRPGRAAGRIDGDLVISLDRLAVQARRFRVSRGEELARLVIHGALHLAGLDHHRLAERRHMRAREAAALASCRAAAKALDRILVAADAPARGRKARVARVTRTGANR
jgi:probable rRNA maturation factor